MKKRKNFKQTESMYIEDRDYVLTTKPVLKLGIPEYKVVLFGLNALNYRSYDFTKHYGQNFDEITSAVQQTINIMLVESVLTVSTVVTFCKNGFKNFSKYLAIYTQAIGRELILKDITVDLIKSYVQHLKRHYPTGNASRNFYNSIKSVLVKMQQMAWLEYFDFPKNLFLNSNHQKKGQKAFSKAERKRLANALRIDVNEILKKNEPLNGYELTIFLLAIALRSGVNTTPLLEMTTDSIQAHPLKDNRKLLVLYKRRGHNTYIQTLRHSAKIKKVQTVLADVEVMVQHMINHNQSFRTEANSDLLFSYRSNAKPNLGEIISLNAVRIKRYIDKWVKGNELVNDNGEPLQVNVSRFRKTFENRIWELSGGDPFVTAALANHTVKVSQTYYLEAPKEAEKNFNYMGQVRTQELLLDVEVIENNTPVSKCSDIPSRTDKSGNKIYCTNFLSCVRCRNMVVTKDDLYRLFSFYWLIVYEREQVGATRWKKYFAHIVRIIDRDIAPQFDVEYVQTIKAKAQMHPHPAWKHRNQLDEAK